MKKFKLFNKDGCLMAETNESSFKDARKYFASKFSGKYTIRYSSRFAEGIVKEINVRL